MLKNNLFNTIFIPGYVGWSPKEGSGIFDPIKKIENITIIYYKINEDLSIDYEDLFLKISKLKNNKFVVLIVNYFGFVDKNAKKIYLNIKKNDGWIIEDNAHGFFTYLFSNKYNADATFFSLHKLFPFEKGGSLKIINDQLKKYNFKGKNFNEIKENPWIYDITKISLIRKQNYNKLDKIIKKNKYQLSFEPLKKKKDYKIVPQTYPIIIKIGNRDEIYNLMNQFGYGVVSLYHTLIKDLNNKEHEKAILLSNKILNLPVHQDVDSSKYEEMVEQLYEFCNITK